MNEVIDLLCHIARVMRMIAAITNAGYGATAGAVLGGLLGGVVGFAVGKCACFFMNKDAVVGHLSC